MRRAAGVVAILALAGAAFAIARSAARDETPAAPRVTETPVRSSPIDVDLPAIATTVRPVRTPAPTRVAPPAATAVPTATPPPDPPVTIFEDPE